MKQYKLSVEYMIRKMKKSDWPQVKKMMYKLWPDFDGKIIQKLTIFVYDEGKSLGGFIALSIRKYVDGADISPCPHIEGWFVESYLRKKGIGRSLIKAVEEWCIKKGFTQLTSDVLTENKISLKVHGKIGFTPTEKIQYFKKNLK